MFTGIDSTRLLSERLGITEPTTKVFLQRIFHKMGVRTKLRSLVKALDFLDFYKVFFSNAQISERDDKYWWHFHIHKVASFPVLNISPTH